MVNKVILIGRVGKDPELRYSPNGTEVANFSVATTESWKNKDGEKQEKTEWHNIVAWKNLAKICAEYVSKGMLVYIEGKIATRSWEDKQGVKRYSTEIIADTMKMLGGGKGKAQSDAPNKPTEEDNSDIPF